MDDTELLQWQHKTYFQCGKYDEYAVGSAELFVWHQLQCHYMAGIYVDCNGRAAMDFQKYTTTVYYMEYRGRIFLPAAGTQFEQLEPILAEALPIALSLNIIYELHGLIKRNFHYLIHEEPPKPKPPFNNQYDFRKVIGTKIWKNKKYPKNFGLTIWDNIPIVPLESDPLH